MRLLCVPPDLVAHFTPHASRYIDAAIEKVGLSDAAGVEADVLASRALLWLACDGTDIIGAGVTELVMSRGRKLCVIVAWGADDQKRCAHLISVIEDYARAEGCAAVREYGRPGWQRALPDYRVKAVIMEKELK